MLVDGAAGPTQKSSKIVELRHRDRRSSSIFDGPHGRYSLTPFTSRTILALLARLGAPLSPPPGSRKLRGRNGFDRVAVGQGCMPRCSVPR